MEFSIHKITKDQSRDTGMAMVLLLLLVALRVKKEGIVLIAAALQVLNMTVPQIFRPVAVLWLGFSHAMGNVMSKILLAVLFFGVITPIGILRRLLGKDSLRLRAFKGGQDSVMVERNHVFTGQDILRPY